jgi:hypothetical protein
MNKPLNNLFGELAEIFTPDQSTSNFISKADEVNEICDTQPIADLMDESIKKLEQVGEYFNTTNQTGRVLDESKLSAEAQTKLILELFRSHGSKLAPHQVHAMMPNNWHLPVTSVRRAITCLTPKYLTKLGKDQMVLGRFGRMVNCWIITESI